MKHINLQEAIQQQRQSREQGLNYYRLRLERNAEQFTRGEPTEENQLSFDRFKKFLLDSGLEKQMQEILKEVRAKYPKWDGVIRTHQDSEGHVGSTIG